MKKILIFAIFSMVITIMLDACQKQCIQCKTQFRSYLMYKGTDTILLNTSGRDEDIRNEINLQIYYGYNYITEVKDSIYYENYCGKQEIFNLKLQTYDKKYCYPK